jgi:hypothetical protein
VRLAKELSLHGFAAADGGVSQRLARRLERANMLRATVGAVQGSVSAALFYTCMVGAYAARVGVRGSPALDVPVALPDAPVALAENGRRGPPLGAAVAVVFGDGAGMGHVLSAPSYLGSSLAGEGCFVPTMSRAVPRALAGLAGTQRAISRLPFAQRGRVGRAVVSPWDLHRRASSCTVDETNAVVSLMACAVH